MIRSIRTLDRPTPRFHGWATLYLALAAWGLVFLAYFVLVVIAAATTDAFVLAVTGGAF